MKKSSLLLVLFVGLPVIISVVLSIGYQGYQWAVFRHLFVSIIPNVLLGVAIGFIVWLIPFKKRRSLATYTFTVTFFYFQMSQNVATSQELDRNAVYAKELTKIIDTEFPQDKSQLRRLLQEKSYSSDKCGEYADALEYYKNQAVYRTEQAMVCGKLLDNSDSNTLLSSDALYSKEKLELMRKRLDTAYKRLLASYRRSCNFFKSQLRIFKNKKWTNSVMKADLDTIAQKQTDLTLDFCYELYGNIRKQIFAMDDFVVFLLQRDGMYELYGKEMRFESEIDTTKYNTFIQDFYDLANARGEIVSQYESAMECV